MAEQPVTTIANVTAVPGRSTHEGCAKAIVHQAGPAETSVFHVQPGGRVRKHAHTRVWDLFLGIAGDGEILYEDRAGADAAFPLTPNAFCAVPPGVRHEVANRSASEELVFVLVHAPWEGYDHIPVSSPASAPGARRGS